MTVIFSLKKLRASERNISGIPNNEEKNNISFMKHVIVDIFVNNEGKEVNVKRELRFINSLRFLTSSLGKISNNLKEDQFVNMKNYHCSKKSC